MLTPSIISLVCVRSSHLGFAKFCFISHTVCAPGSHPFFDYIAFSIVKCSCFVCTLYIGLVWSKEAYVRPEKIVRKMSSFTSREHFLFQRRLDCALSLEECFRPEGLELCFLTKRMTKSYTHVNPAIQGEEPLPV